MTPKALPHQYLQKDELKQVLSKQGEAGKAVVALKEAAASYNALVSNEIEHLEKRRTGRETRRNQTFLE